MNKTLLLLCFLMISFAQAKPNWVLWPLQSLNCDSTELLILSGLLKDQLQIQGDVEVGISGNGFEDNPAGRKEALGKANASKGIACKINRLEKQLFVSAQKWDSTGNVVYQFQQSFPVRENREAMIDRLAKCLVNELRFDQTSQNDNITLKETLEKERKGGNAVMIVRAGFLYPGEGSFQMMKSSYSAASRGNAIQIEQKGTAFSMETGLGYDINGNMIEGTLAFDSYRAIHISIGLDYLFGKNDFCPYVGGQMGASLINRTDSDTQWGDSLEQGSDGFSICPKVGYIFGRNYRFATAIEVRGIFVINNNNDKGIRLTIGTLMH